MTDTPRSITKGELEWMVKRLVDALQALGNEINPATVRAAVDQAMAAENVTYTNSEAVNETVIGELMRRQLGDDQP